METLAHLAQIIYHGPDWFRRVGIETNTGSVLVTISGAVWQPTVYEIAAGTPLGSAIEVAGGATEPLQAALVGGYSGTWVPLPDGNWTRLLHRPQPEENAVEVGAGVIVALPTVACGLAETARVLRYLAGESARQCGPCTFGLPALAADFAMVARGEHDPELAARIEQRFALVAGRGGCRHPDGAVRFADSALGAFAADLEDHLRGWPCEGSRQAPILPLPGAGELP
jgi:NADH:ubiquinone oxidoreductase subunit F (NADH-binding)